jgi:hypothetical protein
MVRLVGIFGLTIAALLPAAALAQAPPATKPPVCTKNLNPYVMVMKPTEDRV